MKASIIIRAHNSEDTVGRAIESAVSQDFPKKDFEVIVVNDGSKDKTSEILENYKKETVLINQKNKGAIPSANKGFKLAKGKYVILLDADDYYRKNILKEMASVLDKNPEISFVYCDYYEKQKNGKIKITEAKNIFHSLAAATMYRKKDLEKAGYWRAIKLPEYDLLLKTLKKWRGYHLAKPLYYFTRHKESLSGKQDWVKKAMKELRGLHPDKLEEIKKIRKFR
ncbi:MAG: glycosyltransferase family A protein [Candidatus Pacebacteria bacterium]|nr:glycosyltransferase family A protein [Candidatus Paceibacterota bacterium]